MRLTMFALLVCVTLQVDAQSSYDLVIHRKGRSPLRMNISDIDSMTIVRAQPKQYEYVDMGLSVLWATHNIGAETPEDYGWYFAWGETATKTSYTTDNYQHIADAVFISLGDDIANTQYDAAAVIWQGEWRMPTIQEVEELAERCTWVWTAVDGIDGYRIEGPSGEHIFLPAAGQWREQLVNVGVTGYYWTSTQSAEYGNAAYNLNFTGYEGRWSANRAYGFCIRPVCPK